MCCVRPSGALVDTIMTAALLSLRRHRRLSRSILFGWKVDVTVSRSGQKKGEKGSLVSLFVFFFVLVTVNFVLLLSVFCFCRFAFCVFLLFYS